MKISIIIPAYNSEATIEKTLQSIFNQDFRGVEVIVVDGNSTDQTLNVVEKYAGRITKIISEPDNGIYDAINKGLSFATGDYIGMISSNDWLHDDALQVIFDNLNKNRDVDIFHGCINLVRNYSGVDYFKRIEPGFIEELPKQMVLMHPTCFVSRQWYCKYKYESKYKIAGDYEFILRSSLNGAKFHFINKILVEMSDGGMSTTFRTTKETVSIQFKYSFYIEGIKLYINRVIIRGLSFLKNGIAKLVLSPERINNMKVKKWNGKRK